MRAARLPQFLPEFELAEDDPEPRGPPRGHLPENLCVAMARKFVSIDELAAELDLKHRSVQRYRNGQSTPNLGIIMDLADYLGVSPGALCFQDPNDFKHRRTYK